MNNFIERDARTYSKLRFLDIYMAGHKGFIAGGCFKNIFLKERVKDIDIFFECEEDLSEAITWYETSEDYVFSYENKNTKAFKNKQTNVRVELIKTQFGTPKEIISMFDFSITKFALLKKVVIDLDSLENGGPLEKIEYMALIHEFYFDDLVNKKLVLEPDILFPVSTFERALRYTGYGYGLCKESKINLINALQGADPNTLSQALYFGID